jgi:phosphate:Na+ symporter
MVRTGMTRAFGATIRTLLAHQVNSKFKAFLSGLGVTILLQSSTATALLASSFTSSGLILLPAALAIMLGADVGSAVAAQLFSLNPNWLWGILIPVGTFLFLGTSSNKSRGSARILVGLGLILLALSHLSATATALKESPSLNYLLSGLAGEPLLGFIVGAVIAWCFHSGLSAVLLLTSFAEAQLLPLSLALSATLGANAGAAFIPVTALAGTPPEMRRVAVGNLLMRTSVAIGLFPFIIFFQHKLPIALESSGQLVITFHFAFNLLVVIIFMPLLATVSRLTERIVPASADTDLTAPRHLNLSVIDNPSEALACAMREALSIGDQITRMLNLTLTAFEKNDEAILKAISRADNIVDKLHHEVKMYLVRTSNTPMSEDHWLRCLEVLNFTTNLEHIGDVIDKNLTELAAKKIKKKQTFSTEGLAEIREFHARVLANLNLALNAFATRDFDLARRLLLEKASTRDAELAAVSSHYDRLREGRAESIESSAIHLDVIRDLKRINDHIVSICYPMLEAAGALRRTRLSDAIG